MLDVGKTISTSWALFKSHASGLILATLIYFVVVMGLSMLVLPPVERGEIAGVPGDARLAFSLE